MATKYCLIITEIIENRLGTRTDTGCFLKGLEHEGGNGKGKNKVLVAYIRKEEFSSALKFWFFFPLSIPFPLSLALCLDFYSYELTSSS